jgi:hypothetical protein
VITSLLLAVLPVAGCARPAGSMDKLAPKTIGGWRSAGPDRSFGPKKIFDYLDGGAEAYLDYGLVRLQVRDYQRPGQGLPGITLMLFDMGRAADAYGTFTLEREAESAQIGQDSDYEAGLLRFWRGRHFVSITAERETAASRRAVLALGREVARRLGRDGRRPAMMGWLPQRGRDPLSVKYLHSRLALAQVLTLEPDTALALDRRTRVALAEYPTGEESRLTALVVVYPDPAGAARALGALKRARGPGPQRARRCGATLAVVFGPGGEPLLQRISRRIPECGP